MKKMLLGALLGLTGCTASISGTEAGGIIHNYSGKASDLSKADAFCAQRGKAARMSTSDSFNNIGTFDCVDRR